MIRVLNQGRLSEEDWIDWPRVEFEMVVQGQGFLGCFRDEKDLDDDVEFSPTRFGYFKRRLFDS